MKLEQILKDVEYELIKGNIDNEVSDILYNSKDVLKDNIFVARIGTSVDSHNFISDAIKRGATTIVIEKDVEIEEDVTVIKVKSSKLALALMSVAYFKYPAREMTTIGITGTAGKTSTTYMMKAILEAAGKKVGLIGTIGALIGEEKVETHNTTPESYEIQKIYRQMADAGCDVAVMEVSSQGLKMDRVAGIIFDYGVFTNISPDHIGPNEHADFEEYLQCKNLLFKQCKAGVVNADSDRYQDVIKGHTCEIVTFGMDAKEEISLKASNLQFVSEPGFLGVEFDVSGNLNTHFKTSIPGRFSVYNSLCAITVCNAMKIDLDAMKHALENVKVRGRVELVSQSDQYQMIIDYAHNESEMQNLMSTIAEYHPKRIICIFGGGGNRSKLRRYDMGEIAGKMADLSILTEDNPRFEELDDIMKDLIFGLNKSNGKYMIINDRKEAIQYTIENAQKGDMILLIGKGHEEYQDIKGVKYPFNERAIVKEIVDNINRIA